jgi:hypothetical protein
MWVLPAADGVGCFQSNGAGQMSIGACGSGGGGSGTVTLGTQYQLGFYGTNGTIISGSSNITTDAAGDLTVIGALVSGGTGQSTVGYGLVVNTLGSSTANGGDFLYKNASGVTIFSIGATNGLLTVPITGGGVQCLEVSNTGVVSGTSCSGGSMIYPVGSGIPVVVSGTSWGTTVAAPAGLILGTTDTQVVTNKKIHPKALAVTQSATPAMNTDNGTVFEITGLAQAITSMTSGLSGTPIADDIIEIEFTDNGTGRAITWGTSFVASTQALPTTTVASTMLSVYFQWNGVTSKWVCKGVA